MGPFDEPTSSTDLRARRAKSFGPHAATYHEHRPDYPSAGIRWALEPLETSDAPVVVDLGAGTGKLTAGLLAAGASVIAVEPDAEMLAELVRRHPGITACRAVAEAVPLPDNSVDAVVVGQALHWFDQERAFPEIARVLRPGGVLAAFWNTDDLDVDWVVGLQRVSRSGASFEPGDGKLPSHPLFAEFERADFPHAHRRTAETLTATIGTHSHTLVISDAERTELLGRITEYLRTNPETAQGEFDYPLVTWVIRTRPN
ncbi:class I SAM-dependent methyltransferase [Nocardia arthritidis]|uniref:Methyltransferase domain-containing protein n=1 Tax=Nocardia arthritidis TaxID=228602 RepID=A0A6G9Y6W5_9NOCA|nr:class I SAM-dependent methyltransferase [Nocardia arthritidis]QIS08952.1 methyltransferase domain-containing protein [Nocardia arthritidis]